MTYEQLVTNANDRGISMEKSRIFATLAVAQAIRDLHVALATKGYAAPPAD